MRAPWFCVPHQWRDEAYQKPSFLRVKNKGFPGQSMRANSSKRLTVLSEAERLALYSLPDFDDFQRAEYLALSENELALVLGVKTSQSKYIACCRSATSKRSKPSFTFSCKMYHRKTSRSHCSAIFRGWHWCRSLWVSTNTMRNAMK